MSIIPRRRFTKSRATKAVALARRFKPIALAIAGSTLLTGCLITSPYYGQKFANRDTAIPFTVEIDSEPGANIQLQCAKANAHGSKLSGETFETFGTLDRPERATYAPDGSAKWTTSGKHAVPESCWRFYSSASDGYPYLTVVRVKVGGFTDFRVFDRAGLKCLGEAVGDAASFYAAASGVCEKRYSNTNGRIHHVYLKSK